MLEGTTPTLRTTPQAYINLSNNKLSGEVNWSTSFSAAKINLSWNEFNGVFWLPTEGSLKEFDISHNKFTKFFPLTPHKGDIQNCDARDNEFQCPIPSWLKEKCGADCIIIT